MDVVLINQSTSYLMIDIVNAYSEKYENVILFAGSIKVFERNLSSKVRIEKIKAYDKSSIFSRIWTWLVAYIQIVYRLKTKYRKAYVVYVTNPPLSYWAALFNSNPFSIIEYDIYPDALKNIGVKESNIVSRIWTKINRHVFRQADNIFTLSDGMRDLLSKYVPVEKIKVIHNWSSNSDLKPIDKSLNPFRIKHNLNDKFVVMYSGNIGYTHNVELIIDLAIKLKDNPDFYFVIIGDGGKKQDLIDISIANNLSNCLFLDWLPVADLKYSLAAADLSIITLTEETALVSVPSKTYNLLAVGSPLLCIAPKQSEIARLVFDSKCGMVYEKTEVDAMCDFIMSLRTNEGLYRKISYNSLMASRKYTYINANEYVV